MGGLNAPVRYVLVIGKRARDITSRRIAMHVVGSGKLTDYAGNLERFINQIPDYALFMLDSSGRVVSRAACGREGQISGPL